MAALFLLLRLHICWQCCSSVPRQVPSKNVWRKKKEPFQLCLHFEHRTETVTLFFLHTFFRGPEPHTRTWVLMRPPVERSGLFFFFIRNGVSR
jgi:hypothetical protein